MKSIKKGIAQTISLDQAGIGAGKTIKLSIIGENGNTLLASDNSELKNLSLAYNEEKYQVQVTIKDTEPDQYIRLFFFSPDAAINNDYYPEDAKLEAIAGTITSIAELVPVQYFIDFTLDPTNKIEPGYKKAITNFVNNKKDGLRSYLLAAEGELETEAKLYFLERTIEDEKRDYYFDRFSIHLWQFDVFNPPINELVSFKVYFGNNQIMEIDRNLLKVDNREMGMIEFLPISQGDSAGIYALLMNNLNGVAVSLLSSGAVERIPGMFQVSYKTGLIYPGCDSREKEAVRQLVCKRAFRKLIPFLDPAARAQSMSESSDGVSASISYSIDKILERFEKEEKQYISDLRMKYGRNVDCVII